MSSIILHQKREIFANMSKLGLVASGMLNPMENVTISNDHDELIDKYSLSYLQDSYKEGFERAKLYFFEQVKAGTFPGNVKLVAIFFGLSIECLIDAFEKTEIRQRPSMQGWLYVIKDKASGFIKIGVSCDVDARIESLSCGNPNLRLLYKLKTPEYKKLEKQVHFTLSQKRVKGEWFKVTLPEIKRAIRQCLER